MMALIAETCGRTARINQKTVAVYNRRTNNMSKTIRTKVYQFAELSEQAQEKAINEMSNINTDYEWWEYIYDDAENVGMIIYGFDIDRSNYCNIKLLNSAYEVAIKIVAEHGEMCETHKTAKNFIAEWNDLIKKYSDGIKTDEVTEEDKYEYEGEREEIEDEFKKSISENYIILLQQEFEYLTSEQAIIETIEANDYWFNKEGRSVQ